MIKFFVIRKVYLLAYEISVVILIELIVFKRLFACHKGAESFARLVVEELSGIDLLANIASLIEVYWVWVVCIDAKRILIMHLIILVMLPQKHDRNITEYHSLFMYILGLLFGKIAKKIGLYFCFLIWSPSGQGIQ